MQIVIFGALYLLSFPLVWYENMCIVLDIVDRPRIYSPKNQPIFYIVRLAFSYGGILGLWWHYRDTYFSGLPFALMLFLLFRGFSKWTFSKYYHRELQDLMDWYMDHIAPRERDRGVDEQLIKDQALQFATGQVKKHMAGESV